MNKRTKAKIQAYQKVNVHLKDEAKTYESFEPLQEEIEEFQKLTTELGPMADEAMETTEGLSEEKKMAFKEVSDTLVNVAAKGYVWAKKNKKVELLATFDVEKADLKNAGVFETISLGRNLEKAMRPLLPQLEKMRITPALLDGMINKINQLETTNPKPRQKKGAKKELRKEIQVKVKAIDDVLENIELLIASEFSDNTLLVNTFLASRRIDDPSSRKTSLIVEVSNPDGSPAEGVLCDVEEMENEEQYTDDSGLAEIKGMKSGKLHLRITKNEFKEQVLPIELKRGQRLKVNAKLEKS